MKKIVFSFLLFALISSCKKEERSNTELKQTVSDNAKPNLNTQSTAVQSFSQGPYSSQIFHQIDPAVLLQAINSNNTTAGDVIINSLTSNIDNLYFQSHQNSLFQEFSGDRNKVLLFGLFMAKKEQSVYTPNNATPTLDCFLTAITSIIGITDAKNIWKSIVEGASEETVVAALKLIGKRVAGVITLCVMVYEVGECLDWW